MVKNGDQNEHQPQSSGALFSADNISIVKETAEIYFYSDIRPSSILKLNSMLSQLSHELLRKVVIPKSRALSISAVQPITLHINSVGGWVTSGLAGMDAILTCPVPVATIIEGEACSAATLLSIAGAHRAINKHSRVLVHQLSAWNGGTYEDLKAGFQNVDKMHKMLRTIYLEHTKIPENILDNKFFKKDIYLTAKEALKYGIVDEIL